MRQDSEARPRRQRNLFERSKAESRPGARPWAKPHGTNVFNGCGAMPSIQTKVAAAEGRRIPAQVPAPGPDQGPPARDDRLRAPGHRLLATGHRLQARLSSHPEPAMFDQSPIPPAHSAGLRPRSHSVRRLRGNPSRFAPPGHRRPYPREAQTQIARPCLYPLSGPARRRTCLKPASASSEILSTTITASSASSFSCPCRRLGQPCPSRQLLGLGHRLLLARRTSRAPETRAHFGRPGGAVVLRVTSVGI